VELLDWGWIVQEVYDFKIVKDYWNLVLDRNVLKNLLLSDRYKIMALPQVLEVRSERDARRVEDMALLVIKKYLDLFYRKYAKRFETDNLRYETVGKQLPLFVFEKPHKQYSYTVQIDKREKELIKEIKNLARDLDKLLIEDTTTLPRIHFDNHLYVPILLQGKKINKISPEDLVESEQKFVLDLREYLRENKDKFSVEIYLLRNYPKSGVGFFNLSGFYPDFIMWVKNGKRQIIVFIDPKGLEHTKGLDDEKIKLREDVKQLEQKLGKGNVALESFVLSVTRYEKWMEGKTNRPSEDECAKKHNLLFLNDKDWPDRLFGYLLRRY